LTIAWRTRTFVNCPFDNKLAWLVKALAERELGKLVVMLLPVDTSTQWSRRYVMRAQEIRFIEGHLRFDDGPTEAPGASCVVVFRPGVRATLAPIVSSLVTMPSTSQEGDDK